MTSIRKELLWTLLPAVLALMAIAVLAVLHEVRDELNELFDAQLAQAALAIPATPIRELAPVPRDEGEDDPRAEMVIATWLADSAVPTFSSPTQAPLSRDAPAGFSTSTIGADEWRVYVLRDAAHTVEVAQPLRIRDTATLEIAGRVVLPLVLLVPAVILTVLLLVKRAQGQTRERIRLPRVELMRKTGQGTKAALHQQ